MRIIKAPQERKDEIIEASIKLFSTKGYDKTSISDIAKELNIAQGLCYRYFPSKEILFEEVLNKYANNIVNNILMDFNTKYSSLKSYIENINLSKTFEDGIYKDFFHSQETSSFHKLLSLKVCDCLVPIVKELLEHSKNIGEVKLPIDDIDTVANFCIYGQIAIINNKEISLEERCAKIKKFLLNILNF
ncbi:MAG: TetR/AcrR family transcriptional regulator [Sarcina sp.]